MTKLALLLSVLVCTLMVNGQTFTEVALSVGIDHSYEGEEYGGGASFYDVNHDGWDDLTLCQSGTPIQLYLNEGGTFADPINVCPNTGNAKSVCWVDYDNDGDADLFVTRFESPWTLLRNDGNLGTMTDVTSQAGLPNNTNYRTYGQAWGDIDLDGDLDLYISNYNSDGVTNLFYLNNGDGTFTDITMSSGADDGSVWSFQPNFMDYDQDMYPDLFVINDRLPASNHMYHNNGDGTFTNVTTELGLEYYIFSMNNTCADYDQDGDLDIYVSNNPFGNLLHRFDSEAGVFEEVAVDAGVAVNDHSWSAQWFDADNDTWEDLHVSCSPFWNQPGQNRFFKNAGDGTFAANYFNNGFEIDHGASHTTVTGDYNNDGFADLCVILDAPDKTRLFETQPNDNNYIKVGLNGVLSNTDGIGSWLHLWIGEQKYIRYTHCGEGYMSQNSQYEIFGLGAATAADSLVVYWPSGHVDRFYDVSANETYNFTEGESLTIPALSEHTHFCEGDSIMLTASYGLNPIWSNGISGVDTIWVSEPGSYHYTAISSMGLPFTSQSVVVDYQPEAEFAVSSEPPLCHGAGNGTMVLNLENAESYDIFLGDSIVGTEVFGLHPGLHTVSVVDALGCMTSQVFEVSEQPLMETFVDTANPLCSGQTGSADVVIINGTAPFSTDWGGLNPEALPHGSFEVLVTDANGCEASSAFDIVEPQPITLSTTEYAADEGDNGSIVLEVTGGTEPYTISWIGPGGFTATGAEINGLSSGVYNVIVTDANGCMKTHSVFLSGVGMNEVLSSGFTIVPNPATSTVRISNWSDIAEQLTIYDMNGRLVQSYPIAGTQNMIIDVSAFAEGMYLIVITGKEWTYRQRLSVLK
jgi:hypothetical protein